MACGQEFGLLVGNFEYCKACKQWVKVVDRAIYVRMCVQQDMEAVKRPQEQEAVHKKSMPPMPFEPTDSFTDLTRVLGLWK